MENANKKAIVIFAALIITYSKMAAQFNSAGVAADIYGQTDDPAGTPFDVRRVGIGGFNAFNKPAAAFHVNANLLTPVLTTANNTFLPGEVFRTTGPATNINAWRLFTGTGTGTGTEKFNINVPAGTGNAVFETPQAFSRMFFRLNNGLRMIITDNGLANANGRIAMGNNLPTTFNPLSRLHLHQFGGNTEIRFTNDNIINGFILGNDNIGTAYANQLIAQDFYFSTNNAERMRIIGTTGATQGFVGINTATPTRRLDVNGKVKVQDLTSNGADAGIVTYFNDGTLQNLAFNGNSGQALLGDGTWGNFGTGTISSGTNGNVLFGTNQIGWGSPLTQNTTIDKTNFELRFIQSAANSATSPLSVTHAPRIGINIGPSNIVTDAPLCVYGPIHSTEIQNNGGTGKSTILYSNTSQTGNPANAPTQDGIRLVVDRGFKGANNDAFIIEKTDGNQADPDGCIAFVNTGNDSIEELAMKITGNGFVGIGQNYTGISNPNLIPQRRLEILENNKDSILAEPQLRLTFKQADPGPVSGLPIDTAYYTDFQSTPLGDLAILPILESKPFFGSSTFTQRRVGINTISPGNSLEVNSAFANAATPNGQNQDPTIGLPPTGWAGLRFTDLNSASIVQANPGTGVLSVDDNGDVIYVTSGTVGAGAADNGLSIDGPTANLIHLGQTYTGAPAYSGAGELLDDREIPLNGFDLIFSGIAQAGKDRISIGAAPFSGTDVTTFTDAKAKLSTLNATEDGAAHFYTLLPSTPTSIPMYYGAKGTVLAQHPDKKIYGLYGQALTTGVTFKGIGVFGEAIGSGLNIGVYGKALGGLNPLAGFFDGDVYVNAGINSGTGYLTASDQNYKTNIDSISDALYIINQLKPKEFYYDTTNVANIRFSSKKQFGFIAQEVETVLPNLVGIATKPSDFDTLGNVIPGATYKTLNYQGFEAINTKAIQELSRKNNQKDSLIGDLQNQINQLATLINSCCQNTNTRTQTTTINTVIDVELSDKDIIVLNQNLPNPFAEQTIISYSIPEKSGFAQIIFNDMKGQIIKVVDVKTKGKGQLNVFANDLSTGMYTYSLYVDGKLIDTKKMVKTE